MCDTEVTGVGATLLAMWRECRVGSSELSPTSIIRVRLGGAFVDPVFPNLGKIHQLFAAVEGHEGDSSRKGDRSEPFQDPSSCMYVNRD